MSVGSTPNNGASLDMTSQTLENGLLDVSLLARVAIYDWIGLKNILIDYGNKDIGVRLTHTFSIESTVSAVLQKFFYDISLPSTSSSSSTKSRLLAINSQTLNVSLTNSIDTTSINVIVNVPTSFNPGFPILLPNTSFNVNYLNGIYILFCSIS